LEFGSGGHAAFVRVADQLRTEFGAVVVDDLSNPDERGKEYLWLQVGPSRLLLMRREESVALGSFYPDVPQVVRVGAAFGARRRGWRWPLYDMWGWLVGHRGPAETGVAPDP
jgi:hypothetical protein